MCREKLLGCCEKSTDVCTCVKSILITKEDEGQTGHGLTWQIQLCEELPCDNERGKVAQAYVEIDETPRIKLTISARESGGCK